MDEAPKPEDYDFSSMKGAGEYMAAFIEYTRSQEA